MVLRAGDVLRPGRAGRGGVGRARRAVLRAPAARGPAGDRRRADRARAAARAGRHLQLQRLRARRAGRAGRRDARRRASALPTARRPRAPRSAPRSRTPTSWWSPAACRSARTTTSRARSPSSGREERFWGVSLRPGKPIWFGTRGDTLAFGLPGNPVSAMVTFQLFVRPALAALQGADPSTTRTTARLERPVARNPRREQAVRVRLTAGEDGWRAVADQGRPGLARAHLDAGRRRAGADRRRARARRPPASAWRWSCCEAARPAAVLERRRRARARVNLRAPAALGVRGGRQHRVEAGGRGHAAARGARPGLVGRVPRALRAHLLALPHARLARRCCACSTPTTAARWCCSPARSCCCASRRPSTRSTPTAARSPGRSSAALLVAPNGRGRGYLRLGVRRLPARRRRPRGDRGGHVGGRELLPA